MGVSAEAVNPDLSALINGGDDFLKRIAELKSATDAHAAALAELNLGQSAKAAQDQAQNVLDSAKIKRDSDLAALSVEVQTARNSLLTWSQQIKDEAARLHAEAVKNNAAALIILNEAQKAKDEAGQLYASSNVEASSIVANAQFDADKIISEAKAAADKLTADSNNINNKAVVALLDAQQLKAKYADAHATLTAAVSKVMV